VNELRIQLKLSKDELSIITVEQKISLPVQLILEAGSQIITLNKNIETGNHREMVRLQLNGDLSILFPLQSGGQKHRTVNGRRSCPGRLRVVMQGEQVSKRIKVANKGWNKLKCSCPRRKIRSR